MGLSTIAWSETMRKQTQETARKLAERVDKRREAYQERVEELAARGELAAMVPAEQLVCPGCLARYDFGYACPDCDLCLVGASASWAAEPEVFDAKRDGGWREGLRMGLAIWAAPVIAFGSNIALLKMDQNPLWGLAIVIPVVLIALAARWKAQRGVTLQDDPFGSRG